MQKNLRAGLFYVFLRPTFLFSLIPRKERIASGGGRSCRRPTGAAYHTGVIGHKQGQFGVLATKTREESFFFLNSHWRALWLVAAAGLTVGR